MSLLTLVDKNGKRITPRDRFFGFGTIQEVRLALEKLEAPLRGDLGLAYSDDFAHAAAALCHFEPAEFARLSDKLKGRGLAAPRWERLIHELERQERARISNDKKTAQAAAAAPEPIAPPPPPPWAQPVVASDLLDEIHDFIARFIVVADHALIAIVLWIAFAHFFEAAECSPRLAILSPTKQCGKTRVLELLFTLCPKPITASNLTSSVVFRVIELECPTLLIDEADTFITHDDQLRGVVNSGHTPATAYVIRNVRAGGGDDWVPKRFSTWAPLAIAGIGKLPATIEDRSIIIRMRRKPRTRRVEPLTRRNVAARSQAAELAAKLARLVADNLDAIKNAHTPPANIADRAENSWEPLLAIADLAGADWAERAREAARALSLDAQTSADASDLSVSLLRNIRLIFTACHTDRLASAWIAAALTETEVFEDGPWRVYGRAHKPINQYQIAQLLKPFGIYPDSIRLANGLTPKGYKLSQFRDAFAVYLAEASIPPSPDRNTATTAGRVERHDDFKSATAGPCCGLEDAIPAYGENECCGVADHHPPDEDDGATVHHLDE
jgi:hypothetical protein